MPTSYNVRVFKLETYEGKKRNTYYVRWRVANQRHAEPFVNDAQADAFRSELIHEAKKGELFDVESGLPVKSLKAKKGYISSYKFFVDYVDMRWPKVSASQRKNTAHALMTVLVSLLKNEPHSFKPVQVRTALREFAFNSERRDGASLEVEEILAWVERSAPRMSVWLDTEVISAALDAVGTKLNGRPVAKVSLRRDRTILFGLLKHAVVTHVLEEHPFELVEIAKIKTSRAIDKRSLLSESLALRMLTWVKTHARTGACLFAFLAVLYFAGLRPEEAAALRVKDLTLPDDGGWGEIIVHDPAPHVGSAWTDSGKPREERDKLKGRDTGESRGVPAHPVLVRILRAYIADPYPRKRDAPQPLDRKDQLFSGEHGGELADSVIRRNWLNARAEVLDEEDLDTPLAQRVYDLRHTCLTNWLNSGVPPAQVAEWAGNSVAVLLSTYVNCIAGTEEEMKRRVLAGVPGADYYGNFPELDAAPAGSPGLGTSSVQPPVETRTQPESLGGAGAEPWVEIMGQASAS